MKADSGRLPGLARGASTVRAGVMGAACRPARGPWLPLAAALLATLLVGLVAPRAAAGGTAPPASGLRTCESAGAPVSVPAPAPVVRVRRYRMAGSIRPLLFWIRRDDVGLARVVWRADGDRRRGYELLVGTDPNRAPRRINRWGYIAEHADDASTWILAVMSRADEGSLGEVQAAAERDAPDTDFRAIQSRIADGSATSRLARVRTPVALDIHGLDGLLPRVEAETAAARACTTALPPRIKVGFLAALAGLVDRSLDVLHQPGSRPRDAEGLEATYAFGEGIYELHLRRLELSTGPAGGPAAGQSLARASFVIVTLATGQRTGFEMSYGTAGDLRGVPVAVSWQPRWWLRVELNLTGDRTPVQAATP